MTESSTHERTDEEPAALGFGKGGVPWFLLLYYLAFLVFFTWYTLEYQLPDYLEEGPGGSHLAAPADE